MRQSLYETVQKSAAGIYPFHMPGHKRNPAFLPENLYNLDVTEHEETDNLHEPMGAIKKMLDGFAVKFGSDECFFLVNGSSCGILAAVCSACGEGDKIIVARNSHLSVYNALAFSGASPIYAQPEYTPAGFAGGFDASKIKKGVKAVVVTSPTYEGYVSDIRSIAEKTHSCGAALIVDESHGAHFSFHGFFPETAISMGADIAINSLHKTLPAFSQCAVLHVRRGRVDMERLRLYLRAAQTSSPSYMLMASAEYALKLLWENDYYFDEYVKMLRKTRDALPGGNAERAVRLAKDVSGSYAIFCADKGKLMFEMNAGMTGSDACEILTKRFGLRMEFSGKNFFLAMTSVADTAEGFGRLTEAIENLNAESRYIYNGTSAPRPPDPVSNMTPREALSCEAETVGWEAAAGRVAGSFITKFPPGVPLAAPGEIITDELLAYAFKNGYADGSNGVRVLAKTPRGKD